MLESGLINLISSKTQVVNTHNQRIESTIAKICSAVRSRVWPDPPYITENIQFKVKRSDSELTTVIQELKLPNSISNKQIRTNK